jgi:hypothetical protein
MCEIVMEGLTFNLKFNEMKRIIMCLMAVILTLTIVPSRSFAASGEEPTAIVTTKPMETSKESAEAKALLIRLDEIKTMDKSKLDAKDKKALRKEVRSIKRELKDISGGVYISAGALIVILILLILLT